MTAGLSPKLAFARTTGTPNDGYIQFYDGYFPALAAGDYTVSVTHSVTSPGQQVAPYSRQQKLRVQAPEFTLDPAAVQQRFPPDGGIDVYDRQLPFVVLADPSLPWERRLTPGQDDSKESPWLALVLFAEGQIPVDPQTGSPLSTVTAQELLKPETGRVKPALSSVPPEMMSTRCQTLLVPADTFTTAMSALDELRYLAHCRGVNLAAEDQVLVSAVLANRFPLATAPTRYYAHLVSLEGLAAYLRPSADKPPKTPIPSGASVQMVSLANWSFVSLPEQGLGFGQLVQGLIDSQSPNPNLALPLPTDTTKLPPALMERLQQGYVPLDFVTGAGPQSFAWYRGPFTPVVPQALPRVGNPPTEVKDATSSDALMIYLAQQGVFDLSYAAAWQLGRALALADAGFTQAVRRYRLAAARALATLAQRAGLPHFAGETDYRTLLAPIASRKRLGQLMAGGLHRDWTDAACAPPSTGEAPAPSKRLRPSVTAPEARTHLQSTRAVAAIAAASATDADSVARWIARLRLLFPVPFSHLVPSEGLLPVESIRFFYLDPAWLDALQAGAMSIGIHDSRDLALQRALAPHLADAVAAHRPALLARPAAATTADTQTSAPGNPGRMTGMLIRSALISGWPKLVVTATAGGVPLTLVRDECLAPAVRLCLFEGVPDAVSLSEPYQGLRFGVEENGVALRQVSGPPGKPMMKNLPPTGKYEDFLSNYVQSGGVLKLSALARDLATGVGAASGFGAGDFALQMVQAPEKQTFSSHAA